jgi:hypothetical protein
MKAALRTAACALAALCIDASAHAQQINQLACQGIIANLPAMLAGTRQYAPYNALGDGYVRFNGSIRARGNDGRPIDGRITYEGYTNNAPFPGVIESPLGVYRVGVLDNTGGRMIIYDGRATLGPPQIFGEFACDWR